MEMELYRWVLEKRELGLEVNDTDIRERALEIVPGSSKESKFKASRHWCYKFRKRFRLVRRAVTHTARKMIFTEEDVVSISERVRVGFAFSFLSIVGKAPSISSAYRRLCLQQRSSTESNF